MSKGDKTVRVGERSHKIANLMGKLEGKSMKHVLTTALDHYAHCQLNEMFLDRDKALDQLLLLSNALYGVESCQK